MSLEISDLGGYTNNLSNKEGIKKLLELVNGKVSISDGLPAGKETTDTVTFQDLIDLGIITVTEN